MTTDKTVCSHLLPFLTQLTAAGASIERVDEGGWSNCKRSVCLNSGPTFVQAKEMFALSAEVKLWFNDDGHYSLENGLFCETCKQSLAWPRLEAERGAR